MLPWGGGGEGGRTELEPMPHPRLRCRAAGGRAAGRRTGQPRGLQRPEGNTPVGRHQIYNFSSTKDTLEDEKTALRMGGNACKAHVR